MGVFEHFPYVNFHELNFAWMIAKIQELEDIIATQVVDLVARAGVAANAQAISNLTTTVNDNATTAHNEALAAQNTANTALTNAGTAQSTATSAQNAASAAQNTANTAVNALPSKLDNGTLLQNAMYAIMKETTDNAGTVFFTNSANRYTALIIITKNDGTSSLYTSFYKNGVTATADLVSGTATNIYTDSTTGNLGVPLPAWSSCNIICTTQLT